MIFYLGYWLLRLCLITICGCRYFQRSNQIRKLRPGQDQHPDPQVYLCQDVCQSACSVRLRLYRSTVRSSHESQRRSASRSSSTVPDRFDHGPTHGRRNPRSNAYLIALCDTQSTTLELQARRPKLCYLLKLEIPPRCLISYLHTSPHINHMFHT